MSGGWNAPTDCIIQPLAHSIIPHMPANILNLPSYQVISVADTEHDYHVHASIRQAPTACVYCQSDNIVGFGRREQLVRDLPMHGRRVAIYVDPRRMQCRGCNRTFSEPLPDADEARAMTRRLVDWIGKQAVKRTFSSIAEEVGVVEGTIRLIFKDYVAVLERTMQFETPKWMGIDEIHLIRPRCVISNVQNNTIVDMLVNRNKDTVVRYLSKLPARDKVQYVAMDMWVPYRVAVEAVLPDARIVIDKFHVIKMANEAMEKVRKSLRAELTPKQRRGLMHDRFVLLKRERELTDQERFNLDGWCKNYPVLGEAYRLKEAFFGIYDADSSEQAIQWYESWYRSITPETHPAFADLIRAWGNWQPYIISYFDHPITNAYTESLNSLIRVMSRVGRGYSFEALRAKMLFSAGLHKHTLSRPKFERKQREPKFVEDAIMERSIPDDSMGRHMFIAPTPTQRSERSTQAPKNYGVDISTLARWVESGEI
jgi:transposase